METIIEEGIWNIEKKLPLRKCIIKYDGKSITRRLFILGDSIRKNNKVDVIDDLRVSIEDINKTTPLELGNILKDRLTKCIENNVNNEIPFFTSPIITTNNV